MPPTWRLAQNLRLSTAHHRPLYLLAFTVLFWTMFDDVLSYVAPLILTQRGLSDTMMGVVYSSSSVVGGIFDFIMSRFVKHATYRRILMIMFGLCFLYPLILWEAKVLWMFLVAMAWWGVYFDLYSYAAFDFVGHNEAKDNHASSFGVLEVFRGLGGIIAPLAVGLIVIEVVDFKPFVLAWSFLAIGAIFLVVLLLQRRKPIIPEKSPEHRRRRHISELKIWATIGRKLFPVLSLSFFLFLVEAFFWTLAPLYAVQLELHGFGGLLLTAYALPALLVGWFVGRISRRLGKKRTAFFSLMLGSLLISTFVLIHNPLVTIFVTFAAASFLSISMPSINGAYANYIVETPGAEREIEAMQDFTDNLGYIVGPVLAGFLADTFQIPGAFTVIGVTGVVVALVLMKVTPRRITLKIPAS